MDFISDIRKQVNSFESSGDKYSKDTAGYVTYNQPKVVGSSSISSIRIEEPKIIEEEKPVAKSALDFFLNELESRNFFNNKLKEQQRLHDLERVREEVVTKLKELHIENKLNPVFIKELLNAIEVTYKNFKEDMNLNPDNFYISCLNYIDSRRPKTSDYKSHVDF